MIIEKIRSFLEQSAEFKSRLPDNLKNDDPLIESGIIDSFGIITLISFIEPAFGIRVEAEDLSQENFASLTSIEAFINLKFASKK